MTIYTAIYGPYEELKEPNIVTPGWEYVCYSDQQHNSRIWKVKIESPPDDPILAAREKKILGFAQFDDSIWIDGSFTVNCDLQHWWSSRFISPMTVIQHPLRNCIYKEADACIEARRGNADSVRYQIGKYRQLGVPADCRLIQSGILLRRSCTEVESFCRAWLEEILLSTRDQIGFSFAEWHQKKRWPRVDYDYRTASDFLYTKHFKYRK